MASKSRASKSTRRGAFLVRALVTGALCLVVTVPVLAQGFGDRFPFFQRQRPHQSAPFFPFFPPFGQSRRTPAPRVDYSHAPAAKTKKDDTAPAPVSTIVVLGDSMSDWLAYGLEEILEETPEIGVVRENHSHSGLIRYDSKDETQNWAKMARQTLAGEKANAVVMMIGMHDRRSIRESEPPAPEQKSKTSSEQPSIAAPERKRSHANQKYEFKSDKWVELYIKHIDDTIAALKSRAVPVFWVGLPPIYGTRSTSDVAFLNNLYRERAQKAGITYVDVWDGFSNEEGKYVVYGPDFEGQRRRLRTGDGVHFTKAGARKLAHYVDREIRRVMANKLLPVSLPATEEPLPQATAAPGKPVQRPLAGPVVPLTANSTNDSRLLGGGGVRSPRPDPIATRVLMKGEPPPQADGRADDFAWPRSDVNTAAQPPASDAAANPAQAAPAKAAPAASKKPTAEAKPLPPAPKKPNAEAKAPQPRAASGRAIARRNAATVAGQPVLRPPASIPNR